MAMSGSSIEEEESDISDDPERSKQPPSLSTRPRTESFDKMVSDELMVALAMMRVNSLSSLDEQQKERVSKLRERIKVGESSSGTNHHKSIGKDFEVTGWSNAPPDPNEKAVLPPGIAHELLSGKGREKFSGVETKKTAAEPSIGSSQSGARSHEECGTPGVKHKTKRRAKHERILSPHETIRNQPISDVAPVAPTKAPNGHKIAHEVHEEPLQRVTRSSTDEFPTDCHHTAPGNKIKSRTTLEQGEYNRQEDSNQLEECNHTVPLQAPPSEIEEEEEEEEEEDKLQSESNLPQKESLLQTAESQSTVAGNSSVQDLQGSSMQDNAELSGSSIDKKSNGTNSSTVKSGHKKRKLDNSGGPKNSKARTKRFRFLKGARHRSLPPLEKNQEEQMHHARRKSQPNKAPLSTPQAQKNNFKVVLKPQFTSIAESTPRTGSFPAKFWVVNKNTGARYPQAPKEKERISWKAVLEDASKFDGYRKIHAEKLRREALRGDQVKLQSGSSRADGYLQRHLKLQAANRSNSYSKIHGNEKLFKHLPEQKWTFPSSIPTRPVKARNSHSPLLQTYNQQNSP